MAEHKEAIHNKDYSVVKNHWERIFQFAPFYNLSRGLRPMGGGGRREDEKEVSLYREGDGEGEAVGIYCCEGVAAFGRGQG